MSETVCLLLFMPYDEKLYSYIFASTGCTLTEDWFTSERLESSNRRCANDSSNFRWFRGSIQVKQSYGISQGAHKDPGSWNIVQESFHIPYEKEDLDVSGKNRHDRILWFFDLKTSWWHRLVKDSDTVGIQLVEIFYAMNQVSARSKKIQQTNYSSCSGHLWHKHLLFN